MHSQNPNILRPDTIVGEKYNILLFLSAGGFSNTYLAESVTDGKTVVLKELFNRDYMERDPSGSSIFIRSNPSGSAYEDDLQRVEKEWDSLKRFRNYAGAVKGIDRFSENNTVYIVMEHLSGGSLKQIIKKNGPMRPEEFFKRSKDVLQLLAAMHTEGFIHGDISPDNLVASDDGSFRLIDFGAVQAVGSSCAFNEKLRKEGYTPAEIFNPQNKISPQTDIYSLCAAFYFALTGQAPEDSLERLLFDEVENPSRKNPEIDADTDALIMKGLSMTPQDRWNSIDEMQAVIGEIVKPDFEKEQEAARKAERRRRRKILLISSIAAFILGAAALFCLTHREQIKFKGKETEKIVFYYPEESDPEAAETLRSNLIQKVVTITGDSEYLLQESDQYLEVTLLYSLLREKDIPLLLNKFFNCSYIKIGIYKDDHFSTIITLHPNYIEKITQTDNGCGITLDSTLSEKLSDLLSDPDSKVMLRLYTYGCGNHYWDLHNQPLEGDYYNISPLFDADSGSLRIPDTELGGELERRLFIDCLNQESVPIESFNYERHIVWESKQKTTWGSYQVPASSLRGEVAVLNYSESINRSENMLTQEVLELELEKVTPPDVVILKRRLDTLQIPYACGWEEFDESRLCIALEADRIWEAEAAILFNNISEYDSFIKTASGALVCKVNKDTLISAENGCICAALPSDGSAEEIIDRLTQDGSITLELCLCNIPVLETQVAKAPEDGRIIFTDFVLQNLEASPRSTELFAAFINQLQTTIFSLQHNLNLTGVSFLDRSGEPDWNRDIWTLPGCEKHSLRDSIYHLVTEDAGEVNWKPSTPSSISVHYFLDDEQDKAKYANPYERLSDFLDTVELTNEVSNISLIVYDRTDSPVFHYGIELYANELTGVPVLSWYLNYASGPDTSQDEYQALYQTKEEEARVYLASEKKFESYYKSPALFNLYERTVIDNDRLLLKISVADTSPGQSFALQFEAVNRTSDTMTIILDQMAVNNIMSDVSDCTFTVEPGTNSSFYKKFDEDALHFSLLTPIETVSLLMDVTAGTDSSRTAVRFPSADSYPELPDNLPVPSDAKLLEDTDDFSIYALGFASDPDMLIISKAHYLLINKTDKYMAFEFEELLLNQIQYENFEAQTVVLMPFTLAYTDLEVSHVDLLSLPITNDQIEEIAAKIRISLMDEEENSNPLLEKVYSFTRNVQS